MVKKHLSNVKKDFGMSFYGLIKLDGSWHNSYTGLMGTINEQTPKDMWKEEYVKILEETDPKNYVVTLDVHN